jgi:hypothetical protein
VPLPAGVAGEEVAVFAAGRLLAVAGRDARRHLLCPLKVLGP